MIKETIRLLVTLLTFILLASLVHRFRYGATIGELIKTNFYEILPIRSLFWTLVAGLTYGFLLFSFASLSNLYSIIFKTYYSSQALEHLLVNSIFAGLLGILILLANSYLLNIPHHNPISVNTENLSIRYGIAPRLIKNLGVERFPNEIYSTIRRDKKIRWLFVIAGALCLGLILFLILKNEEYGLGIDFNQPIERFVLQSPSTWHIAPLCTILIIATLIVLLLFDNLDYTFITFTKFLYLKFIL
ncbi:hypothetical protein PI95_031330 [Hassallia byssoidea VB512170]|uniref:Uncharacterized protein n=1 Tax=Hassallia byssoidea VB512170 TaxID=1304833 RepID=A0A846HLI8_9CYAN|nr:hypothetical protein [Hassalia byssoidea]NEU76871.1 hypothetical protein [Hassalia byssoidea VB512170]